MARYLVWTDGEEFAPLVEARNSEDAAIKWLESINDGGLSDRVTVTTKDEDGNYATYTIRIEVRTHYEATFVHDRKPHDE